MLESGDQDLRRLLRDFEPIYLGCHCLQLLKQAAALLPQRNQLRPLQLGDGRGVARGLEETGFHHRTPLALRSKLLLHAVDRRRHRGVLDRKLPEHLDWRRRRRR